MWSNSEIHLGQSLNIEFEFLLVMVVVTVSCFYLSSVVGEVDVVFCTITHLPYLWCLCLGFLLYVNSYQFLLLL